VVAISFFLSSLISTPPPLSSLLSSLRPLLVLIRAILWTLTDFLRQSAFTVGGMSILGVQPCHPPCNYLCLRHRVSHVFLCPVMIWARGWRFVMVVCSDCCVMWGFVWNFHHAFLFSLPPPHTPSGPGVAFKDVPTGSDTPSGKGPPVDRPLFPWVVVVLLCPFSVAFLSYPRILHRFPPLPRINMTPYEIKADRLPLAPPVSLRKRGAPPPFSLRPNSHLTFPPLSATPVRFDLSRFTSFVYKDVSFLFFTPLIFFGKLGSYCLPSKYYPPSL